MNRIIIIIAAILLILWGLIVIIPGLAVSQMELQTVVNEGEKLIETDVGDEFISKYATTNFPGYQTNTNVY